MKKKPYILIIALFIITIVSSALYASSVIYNSNGIFYNNAGSNIKATSIQDAIDELATTCPKDVLCYPLKNYLSLGDYVTYTPSATSATTDPNNTRYITSTSYNFTASVQTYNPSELNLWRVIKINNDGSADIVSEYVSSVLINFSGIHGYENAVYELNRLAGAYETSGITIGHRHFGYNNQTAKITEITQYGCSTGESCNPVESKGGGDRYYTTDVALAKTAFGTDNETEAIKATYKNGIISDYWLPSRYYGYYNKLLGTVYYYTLYHVNNIGEVVTTTSAKCNNYGALGLHTYATGLLTVACDWGTSLLDLFSGNEFARTYGKSIRPVVTLKPGLKYEGAGVKEVPMKIVG